MGTLGMWYVFVMTLSILACGDATREKTPQGTLFQHTDTTPARTIGGLTEKLVLVNFNCQGLPASNCGHYFDMFDRLRANVVVLTETWLQNPPAIAPHTNDWYQFHEAAQGDADGGPLSRSGGVSIMVHRRLEVRPERIPLDMAYRALAVSFQPPLATHVVVILAT